MLAATLAALLSIGLTACGDATPPQAAGQPGRSSAPGPDLGGQDVTASFLRSFQGEFADSESGAAQWLSLGEKRRFRWVRAFGPDKSCRFASVGEVTGVIFRSERERAAHLPEATHLILLGERELAPAEPALDETEGCAQLRAKVRPAWVENFILPIYAALLGADHIRIVAGDATPGTGTGDYHRR